MPQHASIEMGLLKNTDWLQPYPEKTGKGAARGDIHKTYISTAYYLRSLEFTASAAQALGRDADAEKWFDLDVTVPPNTSADIVISASNVADVQINGVSAESIKTMTFSNDGNGNVVTTVSTGKYSFSVSK